MNVCGPTPKQAHSFSMCDTLKSRFCDSRSDIVDTVMPVGQPDLTEHEVNEATSRNVLEATHTDLDLS